MINENYLMHFNKFQKASYWNDIFVSNLLCKILLSEYILGKRGVAYTLRQRGTHSPSLSPSLFILSHSLSVCLPVSLFSLFLLLQFSDYLLLSLISGLKLISRIS